MPDHPEPQQPHTLVGVAATGGVTRAPVPAVAPSFRQVMGHVASGVCVLTTRLEGHDRAMTATTLMSVSLAPPMVLVCVSHSARFHAAVSRSRVFGASVLGAHQRGLSDWFASRDRALAHQLDEVPCRRGSTGVALLDGAVAHLEVRVEAMHPAGDHTIVVGEVLSAWAHPGSEPVLVHHRSNYVAVG